MISAEKDFRQRLRVWSGFEHSIFVQSGSAAINLATEIFALPAKQCLVPALSCWTISGALHRAGISVLWGEVGTDLKLTAEGSGFDASVFVAPWADAGGWPTTKISEVRMGDLTLCPLAGSAGRAGQAFDAAILSFGEGKPLSAGAGGVLLLNDESLAREALVRLAYGRRRERWVIPTERYVFSSHLYAPLADAWIELELGLDAALKRRRDWVSLCREFDLPLRPVLASAEDAGPGVLTPQLLDDRFPVEGSDICRVALAEGLPLLRQPVSPAYSEPAGGGATGRCPVAESLARRLVFIPDSALQRTVAERLAMFFDAIRRCPDSFTAPYQIDALPKVLPQQFAHWREDGLLCRRLDHTFLIYDPILRKRFAVEPAVAAAVQQLTPQQTQ